MTLKKKIKCIYYYFLFSRKCGSRLCEISWTRKRGGKCQNWYPIFEPWWALKNGDIGETKITVRTSSNFGLPILKERKKGKERERKGKEMNSEVFKNHLRSTCACFIANVDCFPLCDHLLQTGIFHQHQYETILDEHRQNRQEARRSLFSILLKKEYTPEQLRNIWAAFRDTKQDILLPKLGSS